MMCWLRFISSIVKSRSFISVRA